MSVVSDLAAAQSGSRRSSLKQKSVTKLKSDRNKPAAKPISVEAQLAKLEATIEWFSGDAVTLDAALTNYAQAVELVAALKQQLLVAENRLEVINQQVTES